MKPKADPRPYPSIAEHLPPNGLIPGSERYALGPLALQKYLPFGSGDWIGFSQGAEAVLARYRKGGQEVTVLIAEYPTQQIAAKRFDAMTPIVHPDPPTPLNETRVVGSLREADLIGLAIAPRAGEFPDGLLREINFGHYVTSNEGKFKATELSMPVYIVGAFVGAGAIMLLAIFSGLGFARGSHRGEKVLPGQSFRPPQDHGSHPTGAFRPPGEHEGFLLVRPISALWRIGAKPQHFCGFPRNSLKINRFKSIDFNALFA